MTQINTMLLEEYPYKNRTEDVIRTEDEYPYGFELYRADTTGTSLVPLCIGAYGFKSELDTRTEAKNKAHEFALFRDYKSNSVVEMFSIYAKIYKMDKNRNVIKESIKTIGPLFEGEINVTDNNLQK